MRCPAIEYCFRVDAGISRCGCDEPKATLVTSPEAAWDGLTIGADFFVQLHKIFVVWLSWDMCQCGVLEVILDVVGGVWDHFCSCCLVVINCIVKDVDDNTVSSDTKLNSCQ